MPPANTKLCGSCSLCCKLLEIEALDKPAGKWCKHCAPPKGCAIHADRPDECRQFTCGWLAMPELTDDWFPARSKIILFLSEEGKQLNAVVDPAAPSAWRQPIYYDQLRAWARQMAHGGPDVVVQTGGRIVVMLPDRDVDLGRADADRKVFIGSRMTASGREYTAALVPKSDA